MATARKWTQDQSRHLSGYKWVGRGSRRLQESVWHLTQCSSGWQRTTANLTRLSGPFNYAGPFLTCTLNVHFWTYSTSSTNFHRFIIPQWFPCFAVSLRCFFFYLLSYVFCSWDKYWGTMIQSVFKVNGWWISFIYFYWHSMQLIFPALVSALHCKWKIVLLWSVPSDNKYLRSNSKRCMHWLAWDHFQSSEIKFSQHF